MFSIIQCIHRPTHRGRDIGLLVLAAFTAVAAACTQTSLTEPDESADKCQVTLTAPQAAIPAGGGTGSVAIAAAAECAWTATTSATWISNLTPASGQGAGSVQFTAAANPALTTREADIDVNGRLARVRQDAAACSFTVAPTALSVAGSGGTGSVTVTTLAGCAWSASTQTPWITITSQANNNDGPGTVAFTVAQNQTGASRTGTLTVAGQTVSVTQTTAACGYSINPASYGVGNSGGTTTVAVTTTQACTWTAASNDSWITVTSGASGTGPGNVGLTVAANTGGARNGTVQIAGQAFSVNQSADACSYNIAPPNQSVGNGAGNATPVAVTTASHCTWTAASNDSWITVTSGASGTGSGSVGLSIAGNSAGARSGTVLIAGQTHTVNQSACAYSLSSSAQTVSVSAGTGTSVTVTTAASCPWTASSNAAWISVTSGAGPGTGSVGWTFQGNTGAQRVGTITIAGLTFTVTQAACTYTFGSPLPNIPATGATGQSVSLTTDATTCQWSASSSQPWLTITAPSGTVSNSGTITFDVGGNSGLQRSANISVQGNTFTITQAACTYTFGSSLPNIPVAGATGQTVSLTTNATSCQWSASSNQSWLTITAPSGTVSNSGTITFDVGGNTADTTRSANISVQGNTFSVTQDACTYTVDLPPPPFPAAGGSANVNVTTNGPACVWTVSESETWITLNSSPPIGGGSAGISYIVDPNPGPQQRMGTITIAGQAFTVTQDP